MQIQLDVGPGDDLQKFQLRAVFQHVQRIPAAGRDDAHLEIGHGTHEIPVVQLQIVAQIQILQVREVLQLSCVLIRHIGVEVGTPEPLGIRAHGELAVGKPDSPDDLHIRIGIPDLRHTLGGDAAGVHIQALAVLHQGQNLAYRRSLVRHDAVIQIHLFRQCAQIAPVEHKAIFQFRLRRGLLQSAQVSPAEIPSRFEGALHRGSLRVQFFTVQFRPGSVGPHIDPRKRRHLLQQLRRLRHILVRQLVERYSVSVHRIDTAFRKRQLRDRRWGRFGGLGRFGRFRRSFLRSLLRGSRCRIRRDRGRAAAAEQGQQQDGQDDR